LLLTAVCLLLTAYSYDFHPDNILISGDRSVVIDWNNAYSGNPLGDCARTLLMFASSYIPPEASKVLAAAAKMVRRVMARSYLREYIKVSKAKSEDIEAWMLPIAAARLREEVPGEHEWLINKINQSITEKGL
jgi:aminoglycoside phosphotransferase (APT) family kinase protein